MPAYANRVTMAGDFDQRSMCFGMVHTHPLTLEYRALALARVLDLYL